MSMLQGRVEGTREAILSILRRRSRVGIEEFATELDLAGATIRRHLDVLLRDGYVSVLQERGGMGRPRYVFSLTEAGAELFPHHYVRLTRRLVDEIMALGPEDTAGRDGTDLADLIFAKLISRLATEYEGRVQGVRPADRAASAAALLGDEGLDFEVLPGPPVAGEVWLLGRGCPCRRFSGSRAGCDHDRELLERLVGAPVTRVPVDRLPHDSLCGYAITA